MKRPNSRARQTFTRRQKAQPRRYADRDESDSDEFHAFPASIQVMLDETAPLALLVQEWLARGVQAFMQAVKHQLAQHAAPPERQLPPPPGPGDEDGHNERTLQVIFRSPRRPR